MPHHDGADDSGGAPTKPNQIVFYDRYAKALRTEKVYGDDYLRWTYGTRAGRLALNALVKRAWFSRWYGWRMDRRRSRAKVSPFIRDYEVNVEEFLEPPDSFRTFNEFFYRALKPTARPIDNAPDSVVFPADGRHLCIPDLSKHEGLLVKGDRLDLTQLVGDAKLAERYERGSLLVSRLCPVDYHRFHFPASGLPGQATLLNGPLLSVNPIALRWNLNILATNKRVRTRLRIGSLGEVLLVEVGATCVGTIQQTYKPGEPVSKGDEKGYFRFGGSSTITIFEPGRIRFDEDLLTNSAQRRELYAKMGDRMGKAR